MNLSSDPISNFPTSWSKNWAPLTAQSQSNNTNTSAASPKAFPLKSGGLSNGAKARLEAGVVVGVLALAAAVVATWLFYRRRRTLGVPYPQSENNEALGVIDLHEKDAGTIYKEAGGEGLPHEAPTDREVHEM